MSNPEGSILVVDANLPPFVERFDDMAEFPVHSVQPAGGHAARSSAIIATGDKSMRDS
ncbi:MAG TPA: hypothetical protein VG291_10015 [Xanthobacteraceae bacterium]|nr:hypothetical protein [Xanthobacteraceae bacterium]